MTSWCFSFFPLIPQVDLWPSRRRPMKRDGSTSCEQIEQLKSQVWNKPAQIAKHICSCLSACVFVMSLRDLPSYCGWSLVTRCCGSTSQHDDTVLRLQVQQRLASRWWKLWGKTKPNFGFTVNSVPTKNMQNERWMIEELEFKWVYPLSQRSADQLECFCWKSWTDERFREVRIRLVCFSGRGKHLLFFTPSLKIKVLSSPQDLNVKSYWVEYTQCHAEIPSVKLQNAESNTAKNAQHVSYESKVVTWTICRNISAFPSAAAECERVDGSQARSNHSGERSEGVKTQPKVAEQELSDRRVGNKLCLSAN